MHRWNSATTIYSSNYKYLVHNFYRKISVQIRIRTDVQGHWDRRPTVVHEAVSGWNTVVENCCSISIVQIPLLEERRRKWVLLSFFSRSKWKNYRRTQRPQISFMWNDRFSTSRIHTCRRVRSVRSSKIVSNVAYRIRDNFSL